MLDDFHISSKSKHLAHCWCLFLLIILFSIQINSDSNPDNYFDPFVKYGTTLAFLLTFIRFLALLSLPQCICNFLGLTLYNTFHENVKFKENPLLAPFICIRTVTRGDYPDLVKKNISRNIETLLNVGVENFILEVVTDKELDLPKLSRIRQLVVPPNYRTKTGALFKVSLCL
jgi:beta-1,4-mannosyltransferase egh